MTDIEDSRWGCMLEAMVSKYTLQKLCNCHKVKEIMVFVVPSVA